MFVLLLCIRLRDAAAVPAMIETLGKAGAALGMVHSQLLQPAILNGPTDPQILWRLCFNSEDDHEACLIDPVWTSEVAPRLQPANGVDLDSLFYKRSTYAAPFPDIAGGIWRALSMSVNEGIDLDRRKQFETEMSLMAGYISTIRNWAFNPVIASSGTRRWSYVWEQDFDNVEGLLGEYRMHPVHFGLIDRWFDAEHPEHILDSKLLRIVCNAPRGVIEPQP